MILHDRGDRLRAPLVPGPYNATEVPDWDNATPVTYPSELQPVSSTELVDDQQRVEGRWRLFLPSYADILPVDRWLQNGVTYEVDGQPAVWRTRGAIHHIEALLRRITGG